MPTSVNRRFYADQSSVMSTYVNFITNLLPGRATSGKTRHGLRTIRASSTCHVSYYRCSSRLMWIFGTSIDVNHWTVSQQEVLLQVAVRTCECVCDVCVCVCLCRNHLKKTCQDTIIFRCFTPWRTLQLQ